MSVSFDVENIRKDFKILSSISRKNPLVYLDSAATAQKPQSVVDTISGFYEKYNANIHRGVYYLSQKSTELYDEARGKVAQFLNAKEEKEVIFVRNATEAINLVAQSWGRKYLGRGDEIIVSHMEHHANIVPWQLLKDEIGFEIKVAPIFDNGELDIDGFKKLFSDKTKLVSMVHVSNALGTINPVKEIVSFSKEKGATVLIDGCQAVPHMKVDLQDLGCDFYVFTGHKLFGPTGIGVLCGRSEIMEEMPPYQGGGDMIAKVDFSGTTYRGIPERFEAGTPNIAGAIGLGAAIDYVNDLDYEGVLRHEERLLDLATQEIGKLEGITIIGEAKDKVPVVSFVMEGVHPHDIGTILDTKGIAIRVGHHCAQPLMRRLGVAATARASFAFYNTEAEVFALVNGLKDVHKMFNR